MDESLNPKTERAAFLPDRLIVGPNNLIMGELSLVNRWMIVSFQD